MSVSAHIFCVRCPGAGVIESCELSYGCWEWNPRFSAKAASVCNHRSISLVSNANGRGGQRLLQWAFLGLMVTLVSSSKYMSPRDLEGLLPEALGSPHGRVKETGTPPQ